MEAGDSPTVASVLSPPHRTPWLAGTESTSNNALELAAFSQPKNEPKSFGTPLVQPFLGGLGHS